MKKYLSHFSSCIKEKKKKDAEGQNNQDAKDAEDGIEQERVITLRHLNIAGLQSFKESGCCKLHNLGGWNEWDKQLNEFYGEGGSRKKQQLPSLLCCFSNGTTGWGLVAYDQPDTIYISAWRKERIEIVPLFAEVLGIRWGLQTTKD